MAEKDITEIISQNYNPAWEGETADGTKKRIYAIIGKILPVTYKRFIDRNGIYLNDKNSYRLFIPKNYQK